ncbi:TetR/AcrR family transcriptional regulator [Paenibacillus sp. 481]|uniref:TetR/AcrR family transcriptional regulator n=1 Tax=Paenibacillus sp. 481 TaxID=2835869 RepID=UPI003FA6C195
MVQIRIGEIAEVMGAATVQKTPVEQLRYIVEGALRNVYQRPEVYRFYLNLQTHPEDDEVLAAYSKLLNEESRKQFEVQCRIFEQLGVNEPRMRSLSFSSALQGAMLMMMTFKEGFPVEKVQEQMIRDYGSCEVD